MNSGKSGGICRNTVSGLRASRKSVFVSSWILTIDETRMDDCTLLHTEQNQSRHCLLAIHENRILESGYRDSRRNVVKHVSLAIRPSLLSIFLAPQHACICASPSQLFDVLFVPLVSFLKCIEDLRHRLRWSPELDFDR